jgi:hypothetical protein
LITFLLCLAGPVVAAPAADVAVSTIDILGGGGGAGRRGVLLAMAARGFLSGEAARTGFISAMAGGFAILSTISLREGLLLL